MRVVFLLSRYTKFFESIIINISNREDVDSLCVSYWSNDHLPVKPKLDLNNVFFVERKSLNPENIFLKNDLNLVYIPGWMDIGYLRLVKKYKKKKYNLITVIGIDDQWHWSARQIVGALFFRFFLKPLFDYAWVAGSPQYMYARMLTFSSSKIGFNLLSTGIRGGLECIQSSRNELRFLFVGRLVKEKNLHKFLRVFRELNSSNISIDIIGDGVLMEKLSHFKSDRIRFHGYLSSKEVSKFLCKSDVFVLPSVHEQWSVALHEAMSHANIGLISQNVGANSSFLIEGYNGYTFDPNSTSSIKVAINKMIVMDSKSILSFKQASLKLSSRIDVDIAAASFLSFKFK